MIFFTPLQAEDVNQVVDESADRVPLHIVADFGQKDVMAFLIEMGADVNVRGLSLVVFWRRSLTGNWNYFSNGLCS